MREKILNNKTVLFIGLKNCKNSSRALNFLESLGCNVTPVLNRSRSEAIDKRVLNYKQINK